MEKIRFNAYDDEGYVDTSRLGEVSEAFVEQLHQRRHPFNKKDLFPDAIVPKTIEEGSLEHALFLLHACSLDARRQSVQVYKCMREMVDEGEIDLRNLHRIQEERLKEIMEKGFKPAGLEGSTHKPWEIIAYNARKLKEEYGRGETGDPREVFTGNPEGTYKALRKFRGIGPGIAPLFLKNMVRFGMWDVPLEEVVPKIDRHIGRIAIGTKIVVPPENQPVIRSDMFQRELHQAFRYVQKQKRLSGIEVDDAYYGIGSLHCTRNYMDLCMMDCPARCSTRPKMDKSSTYFYTNEEVRKIPAQKNLFYTITSA